MVENTITYSYSWIKLKQNEIQLQNAIVHVKARNVGSCSHIMMIVWFLGYGQYHGINIPNPDICNVIHNH